MYSYVLDGLTMEVAANQILNPGTEIPLLWKQTKYVRQLHNNRIYEPTSIINQTFYQQLSINSNLPFSAMKHGQ